MRRAVAFVLGLMMLAASTFAAQAEKRVALVVGNSAYEHIPNLDNPEKDAALMAATLGELGFTLIGGGAQLDLDKPELDRAVQSFGREIQNADVALFYFAGHGVQVRGNNYLVPVGANPVREADVDFQMLDANLVLRQMEGAGSRLNLLILDACRNNPFGGRGLRTAASGLAQMQAPEGTLISFATQPGNVALDGTGANSPFTEALAETIRQPGLGIFRAFNAVGLAVKQATGGSQQPWVSSSPIAGDFFFAGRSGEAEAPSASASPAPAPSRPAPDPAADAWQAVKDSDSVAVLETYIAKFPSSFYADLARARADEFKRKRAQAEEEAAQQRAEEERAAAEERRHKEEEERIARLPAPNSGISIPPAGGGNWFVILGSWPKSQKSKANQRISLLKGKGVQARIIDTNKYPNLSNGLFAVVVGPYSKPRAEQTLSSIRGAVGDAYIKSGY